MSDSKVTPAVLIRMAADVEHVTESINKVATFLDQEAHIKAIGYLDDAVVSLRSASKVLATFYLGSYEEADADQSE